LRERLIPELRKLVVECLDRIGAPPATIFDEGLLTVLE
jgi:hypothetical protein